jgi:4-amino-4-deoxy-L-arabinose transferase-like glycosyltransferase
MIARFGNWFAAAVILAVAALLLSHLPDAADYRGGADEGAYYRQGKVLAEHGIADGYARLAHDYITIPEQQTAPDPLRVGMILAAALAVKVDDSYRSLSVLSVLAFLALLAGVWRFAARQWSKPQALFFLIVLASSPLALGMARRALMDSISFTAMAFSLLAFLYLMQERGRRALAAFIIAMATAILIKHTSVLLLPFYAAVLVYRELRGEYRLGWRRLMLVVGLPPLLTVLVWLLLYGWNDLIAIATLVARQADTSAPYIEFSRGPWYGYLVDFLVLSPWTFLLAALGVGYFARASGDRRMPLLLGFAAWLLIVFSMLPKSARYLLLFDFVLRFFAAAMILALPGLAAKWFPRLKQMRPGAIMLRYLPAFALALVALTDVAAFEHYFVRVGIYDPVTYNLLRARLMVPALDQRVVAAPPSGAIAQARESALAQPDAGKLLQLGYEYCAANLPLECSWASREAVRLTPTDARAFNNLCVAYNGLHQWQAAIAACEQALKLQPDFQLARNNLDWARSKAK